jgi:ATP diphosphatase
MTPTRDIAGLLAIMRALRDPQTGCAWDQAQTFGTIAPYTVEEAHEVADAIAHGDMPGLKDELGDLLLQVVFHAEIASEQNLFDFGDVVLAITSKLVRRHPHIFGDRRDLSPEEIREAWQRIKREERAETNRAASILDDVPGSLPALAGAQKIQNRAATVGFDWNDPNMSSKRSTRKRPNSAKPLTRTTRRPFARRSAISCSRS